MARQASASSEEQIRAAVSIYRDFERRFGLDDYGGLSDYAARELVLAIDAALCGPGKPESSKKTIDAKALLVKIERPVADFFRR